MDFLFSKDEADTALRYWHVREEFHRMVIENRIEDLDLYIKRRDEIEQKLTQEVSGLDMKNPNPDTLKGIMKKGFEEEERLILDFIDKNRNNPARIKGSPYFRYYWKRQNRRLRAQMPMS